MKYSKRFEFDYQWYLSVREVFKFDGSNGYRNKKGIDIIQPNLEKGLSAKECFYLYDSQGVIKETREPDELRDLLRTKGSVNLHIKMYAEDRGKGLLPKMLLDEMIEEFKAPKWFEGAIERQKFKYYPKEWDKFVKR